MFPDGGAGIDITATGTDYSGVVAGEILRAVTSDATALELDDLSAAAVVSAPTAFFAPKLGKLIGTDCTIQAEYTSDATTDVDIKWTIKYIAVSTDGALVAV